ncbi:MAG: hypothetical protein L0Y78_06040 [candidate division NC10 bacterium]|nr:hypothetical protein [candidate division NC10 bacterium]
MDRADKTEIEPPDPRRRWFRVGVILMGASFATFALYAVVPLLTISLEGKMSIMIVGWVIGWCLFLVGSFLAGNKGYLYLRRLVQRPFQKS